MISIFELPTAYTVTFIVMAFIFGAVIGSFLNVVILRAPLKQSIVTTRSHCWTCGKQLKNIDLVPIFSYIFLRGKCRFCGAKISPRYWIVELTTALMYVLCICVLGLTVEMLFAIVLIPVLIILSGIDIDHMQIPYFCSIIIAALGIISIPVFPSVPWHEHLIGAVIVAVPFALLAIFGAMGGGDVQLMAAAGLLLGWSIVPAAAVGICLGALGGGLQLLSVPKGTKKEFNEKLSEIASQWYEQQKENGCTVIAGKSDVVYGSMFKGKSDIEKTCIDEKLWTKAPDIDALNARLNEELSAADKYGVSIVAEESGIKHVSCKKQIVFGPYLSVGIAVGFLFGKQIMSWYLGLL